MSTYRHRHRRPAEPRNGSSNKASKLGRDVHLLPGAGMGSADIKFFREETERYLQKGNKFVEFREDVEDATIAIGMSGAGKTTLIQVLFGNNEKLWSYGDVGSGFLIRDEKGRIAEDTLVSCSSFPELIIDRETDSVIYDCPGFKDTRSASVEISSTRFIKKVVDRYKRIRILAVVNHQFLRPGGDRYGYPDFVKHMLDFIQDLPKFGMSIAIVVSKVETACEDDEPIISAVAKFIATAREELKKTPLATRAAEIHELTEIFLQKTNGQYTNIGIFRRPTAEGRLSDLPKVQASRDCLRRMVFQNSSFQYVETHSSDLRYVLSTEARLVANELIAGLARNAQIVFMEIMTQFYKVYAERMDGIQALRRMQDTAATDFQLLTSITSDTASGENSEEYGKFPKYQFQNISSSLELPLASEALKALEDDVETLCFLEKLSCIPYTTSKTKIITNDIFDEFRRLGASIQSYSLWLSALEVVFHKITTEPTDPNLMKQASKMNLEDSAVLTKDDIIKTELPADIQKQFLDALPTGEIKKLNLLRKLFLNFSCLGHERFRM